MTSYDGQRGFEAACLTDQEIGRSCSCSCSVRNKKARGMKLQCFIPMYDRVFWQTLRKLLCLSFLQLKMPRKMERPSTHRERTNGGMDGTGELLQRVAST